MKISTLIILVILSTSRTAFAGEELYEGYHNDLILLRDHYDLTQDGKVIKASSDKAHDASKRIFSNVSFLFKSRESVLEILGDPATISDYGEKAADGKDAPLLYKFDSGWGGALYKLEFKDGIVVKISVKGFG